jgi:hypothetical protein
MFLVGDYTQQLLYLWYTKYLRQLVGFTGIKGSGYNKGCGIYILKIKAAALRYLVAFLPPYAMRFYDKTDVIYNVLPGDFCRQQLLIMRKQKTHFLHVITDGSGGVLLCQQRVV